MKLTITRKELNAITDLGVKFNNELDLGITTATCENDEDCAETLNDVKNTVTEMVDTYQTEEATEIKGSWGQVVMRGVKSRKKNAIEIELKDEFVADICEFIYNPIFVHMAKFAIAAVKLVSGITEVIYHGYETLAVKWHLNEDKDNETVEE